MLNLEKDIESTFGKFLIAPEEIWQPTDFLPNPQSDTFLEEVKELIKINIFCWLKL